MNTKPVTDAEIETACGVLFGSVFSEKSMGDMRRALEAFAAGRAPMAQTEPVAYRFPKAGINNGYHYHDNMDGEEPRFRDSWEKLYTTPQPAAPVAPIPALPAKNFKTSESGRSYLVDYFATRLKRHDYARYIQDHLAADFACTMADWLDSLDQPVTPPVAQAELTLKLKPLEWSEERQPCEGCRYTHIVAQTALGLARIEWKGWKEHGDDRTIYINDEYIDCKGTSEAAKRAVERHLVDLVSKLTSTPPSRDADSRDAGQAINIRDGAPFDDADFEALCREHGVWGTAESALCAVIWRAAIKAKDATP